MDGQVINTIIEACHYTAWRRRGLAALLGVCATLAQPPVYMLLLLIPSFSGLALLVVHAGSKRQAFLDGWWWGLGYFTAGLYWICISLYVEPEKFAWLTPFALFGLPSVLGIYTGLVTLIFSIGCRVQGAGYASDTDKKSARNLQSVTLFPPFLFATLFVAVEYLRSYLFTGFPWNLIGYVWTVSDIPLQAAWLVGIYGLSWITVFVATAPATFVLCKKPYLPNGLAACLLACLLVFGWMRLEHNPTQYSNVRLRIVQANIAESEKLSSEARLSILRKYIELTRLPDSNHISAVIWPEAAIPYYVEPDSPLTHDLGNNLQEDALLIAGGLRGNENAFGWQAWNSLFVIDHKGDILAQYDKHHLVPFGEFIPLRHILPLENISGGHGDFSRGPGPQTLAADNLPPFSPLICYEAIFPQETTDGSHKARWLLNVTNDAWFGISSGPYQHLQMARVRAVENGLPLVRAANTGISAVIDPFGRILMKLPLDKDGIIDFYLPLPKL